MRVKLADDIANRARRFLVLGPGGQTQLTHRVDDPPLHRLESIADARQGAVENDVHRVIEIGPLGEDL